MSSSEKPPTVFAGHSVGPGGGLIVGEAASVEEDAVARRMARARERATGAAEQRPPRRAPSPAQREASQRNWRRLQLRGVRSNLLGLLRGAGQAGMTAEEAAGIRAALTALEAIPGVVPPPPRDPATGYY